MHLPTLIVLQGIARIVVELILMRRRRLRRFPLRRRLPPSPVLFAAVCYFDSGG